MKATKTKTITPKAVAPKADVIPPSETCSICFEKARIKVECLSCPNPIIVCVACSEEYLLLSHQDAHCMFCKHAWGYHFMYDTFSNTFLTKTYRKNRQDKALEREKGLLQQTLPLVQAERDKITIKEEVKKYKEEINKIKEEYSQRVRAVELKIDEANRKLREGVGTKSIQYLFRCPVDAKPKLGVKAKSSKPKGEKEEDTQCKGFIERESWCCGLCEAEICKKCHVQVIKKEKIVKGEKKLVSTHKCDPDAVETAKLIMADTKPCPKCKTRIYKIVGCQQMFCTACNTPFDWGTGNIVTGVIHNPHYYEMLKKTGLAPRRNAGDAPCGGLPHYNELYEFVKTESDDVRAEFQNLHRRCGEIQDYIDRQRRKQEYRRGFEDIRLKYLMKGYKDESSFKKSIFIRERSMNQKKEEIGILDTFITAATERFNDYLESCRSGDKKKTQKLLEDIEKVKRFCNHAFKENYTALGYKGWPQIEFDTIFTGLRYTYEVDADPIPLEIKKKKAQLKSQRKAMNSSDDSDFTDSDY